VTRLEKAGSLLIGAAILAAVAAALYLAIVPMYGGYVSVTDTSGMSVAPAPLPRSTLAAVNGPGVYLVLILPIALASFPLITHEPLARSLATWSSAVLLTGFCMISAWTVGGFYTPAALTLLLAATLLTVGGLRRRVERADDTA
jgi:hypothetical protein